LASLRPAGEDAIEEIRSPDLLIAHGVRRLTKLVLFPVLFLYTVATGRVGTNERAVARYLGDDEAPSSTLVAAALAWRTVAPTDEAAAAVLLREQMVPCTSTTSPTTSRASTHLGRSSPPVRSSC
jgi:hypothetical protein